MSTLLSTITTSDSVDDFIEKVPKNMRKHVTPQLRAELAKQIDSDMGDAYRESLVTHTDLMTKFTANPERYSRAVKFVTCLNLGKKVYEAFALSHPDKYHEYRNQLQAKKITRAELTKKLSLKGANFKKTLMVTELMARNMVPLALTYNHYRHEGIQVLATLMHDASSERVQMESADKLLTHLNLDKSEFQTSANLEEAQTNAVNTLASALDKMVNIHIQQRQSSPSKTNSEIMDAIVVNATKVGDAE